MVHCRQCGMLNNKETVDHTGGSLSGSGGYGPVTITAGTAVYDPQESGTAVSATPGTGDQAVKKNSGCRFCGSKNFA